MSAPDSQLIKKETIKDKGKVDLISFRPFHKAKVPKSRDIVKEYITDGKKVKEIYDQVTGIIDGKEKEKYNTESKMKGKKRAIHRKNGYKIDIDDNVSKECKPLIEQIQIKFQEISKKNAELLEIGCGKNSDFTSYLDKYKKIEKVYGTVKKKDKSLPKIKYICQTENNINKYNNDIIYPTKVKKKLNMARINDTYRMKLNKTFLKYNPYIHLSRLNQLIRVNTEEKAKISNLKSKVDSDIKKITDPHYYSNKMDEVHNYFLRNQTYRPGTCINTTTGNNNNNTDMMNKTNSTYFNSHNATQNNFRKNKKQRNLSPFYKKFQERENIYLDNLKKALLSTERIMDSKKIEEYIDKNSNLGTYQASTFEDKIDTYFPDIAETLKYLTEANDKGSKRQIENNESDIRTSIEDKNKGFMKLLNEMRTNLINEVDNGSKIEQSLTKNPRKK